MKKILIVAICILIASIGVGFAFTTEMNNQTMKANTTSQIENQQNNVTELNANVVDKTVTNSVAKVNQVVKKVPKNIAIIKKDKIKTNGVSKTAINGKTNIKNAAKDTKGNNITKTNNTTNVNNTSKVGNSTNVNKTSKVANSTTNSTSKVNENSNKSTTNNKNTTTVPLNNTSQIPNNANVTSLNNTNSTSLNNTNTTNVNKLNNINGKY